jgi:hypothetical protein
LISVLSLLAAHNFATPLIAAYSDRLACIPDVLIFVHCLPFMQFRRLRTGTVIEEDEIADVDEGESETNSAVARAMEGDGLVLELNVFNADSFFSDEERAVKAVLFTRKAEVPPLWRQVAMANLRIASFGIVRHGEEDLMERFQLAPEQLPRVMIFVPGSHHVHAPLTPLVPHVYSVNISPLVSVQRNFTRTPLTYASFAGVCVFVCRAAACLRWAQRFSTPQQLHFCSGSDVRIARGGRGRVAHDGPQRAHGRRRRAGAAQARPRQRPASATRASDPRQRPAPA